MNSETKSTRYEKKIVFDGQMETQKSLDNELRTIIHNFSSSIFKKPHIQSEI